MGLISAIFGGGAQSIAGAVETAAGAFMPNQERQAQRDADRFVSVQSTAAAGYGAGGWFNSLVDGLNRLPRPLMAFGVIALFCNAMFDPLSFASRMVGMQAIPPEMWWLIGAVVSFYFGARELQKSREARPIAQVVKEIRMIEDLRERSAFTPGAAADPSPELAVEISGGLLTRGNPAIMEWKRRRKTAGQDG